MFKFVVPAKRVFFLATAIATFGLVETDVARADSCFLSPAKLSEDAVSAFQSDPTALLSANPVGGYSLSSQVRSLAGSDTEAIASLVGLAEGANEAQTAAVGAGLAQAATACVNSRPDISAEIQQAVAESGNDALIAAFAAAAGNTQTAAVGGGAVGGTGGAGGGAAAGIGGGGAVGGGAGGTDSTFSNPTFSLSADGSTGDISTTVVSPN